ncbi:hypothetical protein M0208_14450 [Sphingomonas sp. SUN019]|uniref:hypothetical protein n=1 Tax=Sphingomonas sp. SUN019 TaxID=2937788 RepID=UPI0021640279|nr:hypothetical protein [Sphingomonas sp. SUN019]UVO51648.1 hypothetical protein M0208_14450 [Sphingomonas sp. SUN019]
MKTLVIASGLALSCGVAAAPAMAEPARASVNSSAASGTTAASGAQNEARRYCIVETPTGSRIERKECRTRADWLKQGFDPLDPK